MQIRLRKISLKQLFANLVFDYDSNAEKLAKQGLFLTIFLTNIVSVDDRGSAARRSSTTLHPNLQFYDTQLLEKMNEKNEEIDDDVFSAEGSVSSFCC